ncbi:hypothetical protein NPIL_131751 [Nephila pilipes]|uniref:Uncharacterized protein n=1 Tax=Nephila pilipes TaxID=299642 RepID=A0A8X6PM93_NEPPI|nr:hypothetical protein NPIL_131751 [Nephila pilipes]
MPPKGKSEILVSIMSTAINTESSTIPSVMIVPGSGSSWNFGSANASTAAGFRSEKSFPHPIVCEDLVEEVESLILVPMQKLQ